MLGGVRRFLWAARLGLARRLLGAGPAPSESLEAQRLMLEVLDLRRELGESREQCRLLNRDVEEERWKNGFAVIKEDHHAAMITWLRSEVDKNIAVLARGEAKAQVDTAMMRPPQP